MKLAQTQALSPALSLFHTQPTIYFFSLSLSLSVEDDPIISER